MCILCGTLPCALGVPDDRSPDSATAPASTVTAASLSTEPTALPTQSTWKGLLSGNTWSGGSVTYGFASGASDYYGGSLYSSYNEPAQFLSFSGAGKNIIRAAFTTWGSVTTLAISEAGSGAHPQINVGGSTIPDTAWAYYPSSADSGGDVWFGLDKPYFSKLVSGSSSYIGSYEYATALHEIGHALGLKHPHQGTTTVPAAYDGLEYTVMSYRSYLGGPTGFYTAETWGYPQSLMMLDIAAIQQLYGADYSALAGNTTYRFDPLTGEMKVDGVSAGVPGGNRVFRTLWDGNGTDTIDLSAYSTDLDIDLNPGKGIDLDVGGSAQRAQLSSSVYAAHHIYMSLLWNGDTRSLIENAIGGSGDDVLVGNQAANTLNGGAGDDFLTGGLGADRFVLGAGTDVVTDTLAGLDGDTIADFTAADMIQVQGKSLTAAKVSYNASSGLLKIDADGDGTADATIAIGTAVSAGNLQVTAAGGSSQIAFGTVAVPVPPTSGTGSALTVTLTSSSDTYAAPSGQTVIVSGLGGMDKITGSSGDDILDGGNDNDTLIGGAGDDTLIGGKGKDTLTGGGGADHFVFSSNDIPASTSATDIVADFTPGTDMIEFNGFKQQSFGALSLVQVSSGTKVTVGSLQLTLKGVAPGALSAGDFQFSTTAGNAPASALAFAEPDSAPAAEPDVLPSLAESVLSTLVGDHFLFV